MKRNQFVDYCLTILAFDNIKPQLSIAERSTLHKAWSGVTNYADHVVIKPASKLPARVIQLGTLITQANWQRPELRYNPDRELEVYDTDNFHWKKFKPDDYV